MDNVYNAYVMVPLLFFSSINGVSYTPTIQDTYKTDYSVIGTLYSYDIGKANRNAALSLFGEMRNFTKQESEAYDKHLHKLFKKTGRKRFV